MKNLFSFGTPFYLHSNRWLLIFITLACASGSLFFGARLLEIPYRSALRGWDNSFYLFWVRSPVKDGDFDFHNDLKITNTIAENDREAVSQIPSTETGMIPNKYGIGWGLASLPWFLAADFTTYLIDSFTDVEINRNGFGATYQIFLQLGQLLYALIGLYCLYQSLLIYFPKDISKIAVFAFWAGSPLLYYQSINLSMAHSLIFSLVSIALFLSLKIYYTYPQKLSEVLRVYALIGFIAGLTLVTRYQAIVFLLLPVYLVILRPLQNKNSRPFLTAAIFFSFPVLLQLISWKIVYGSWFLFTYGENDESFHWLNPKILNVLFDPYNGLFYWHPIILLATIGLALFSLKVRHFWGALLILLITIYINAAWWSWHLAASFGHRGFIGFLPYCFFGYAWLLNSCKNLKHMQWLLTITLLLVLWNINLCFLYSLNTIDRNGPVTWTEMLQATWTTYSRLFSPINP